MEKIYLSGQYLKKPATAVSILLIVLIGIEAETWLLNFDMKMAGVRKYGGILDYVFILLRGGILPELVTFLVIAALLISFHSLFKIKEIDSSFSAVLRYELRFLPVLLVAFLFFNPFTQTVRYLLLYFPHYDFEMYWKQFIIGTYSWKLYTIYLIPTLLIGYGILTASLFSDLLRGQRELDVR